MNIEDSAMTIKSMLNQVSMIQEVLEGVMIDGDHYGKIPGCGDKPTLLKPGAEKLCTLFRLSPTYEIEQTDYDNNHREYRIVCTLTHIPTGKVYGQGVGICSTLESKYRYRKAAKKCPNCGKEAIIKGKAEYGGGWLCWKKNDGCGSKWNDGAKEIEDQESGKIENIDIADSYNTVLKIGKKRSHVDATLTVTAASDLFAQDLEDMKIKKAAQPEPTTKKNAPKHCDVDNGKGDFFTDEDVKTEIEAKIKNIKTVESIDNFHRANKDNYPFHKELFNKICTDWKTALKGGQK